MLSRNNCTVCPRKCGADRKNGAGVCGAANAAEVAHTMLHRFEEPFISGSDPDRGSGTVFFSHCPLACVYCQNHKISRSAGQRYRTYSPHELSELFLKLQQNGAYNINLVSPTHYTHILIEAVSLARQRNLKIPIVWNTSGYENADTINSLKGTVDIFLTDFKYYSSALSKKYSNAPDYFAVADSALKAMLRMTGLPRFDKNNMMRSGVVVRHLQLPDCLDDSKNVLKYLYSNYKNNIYISIMSQFTPTVGLDKKLYPELNRTVTQDEYESLVSYAVKLGIKKALTQDGSAADSSFIPDFK